MIVGERLTDFVNAQDRGLPADLEALYQEAQRTDVPVIRRETQSLLRFLLAEKKPEKILEVGTAIGFSALFMSSILPASRITTIENYEKRIHVARENFRRFQKQEQITLIEGDAEEVLPTLPDAGYEFIFMDAAKGQYIHFLPQIKRLLSPGGLLVSDNVLQEGEIIESRFAVTRRNRTIHARMREYLSALMKDEALVSTILTVGDGVALTIKKEGAFL
ncbi:MAG: O-methyltransferase [Lachnospiraceae bacterium]|nr:O-methyltransferase [Lachnospiraceae bacterium]